MMKTVNIGIIHIHENGRLRSVRVPYDVNYGAGAEAFYFQLTKTKGIKLFTDKSNAQISFRRQQKASKYDVAPKVLSKCVFKIILPIAFEEIFGRRRADRVDLIRYFRDGIAWGYYTQHARVLGERERKPPWKDIDDLQFRLRAIFPRHRFDDLHRWNLGFVGKKLVNLDFGSLSSG